MNIPSNTNIRFADVSQLCDNILDFMKECGGPYGGDMGGIDAEVVTALAERRFVMGVDDNGITYFASLWFVTDEDLDDILTENPDHRVKPADVVTGNRVYIAEAAARRGHCRDMVRAATILSQGKTGVYWHRPKTGRTVSFPNQEIGHGKQQVKQ